MENTELGLENTGNEVESRVYEVGFLLVPTLSEEKAGEVFASLKTFVSEKGGTHIAEDTPLLIDLAYTMEKTIENKKEKFDTGYFGSYSFELGADAVLLLKAMLDSNVHVIRFLLVKTTKESVLNPKKTSRKGGEGRKFAKKDNDQAEEVSADENTDATIDTEAIDEKIDELVVA